MKKAYRLKFFQIIIHAIIITNLVSILRTSTDNITLALPPTDKNCYYGGKYQPYKARQCIVPM